MSPYDGAECVALQSQIWPAQLRVLALRGFDAKVGV